jgi:hypothetical protein
MDTESFNLSYPTGLKRRVPVNMRLDHKPNE